jgi:hypothetical protein
VHVLREIYLQDSEVRPFGAHVKREREQTCPGADWLDWGDYAENAHTLTGVAAAELEKLGLTIRSTRTGAGGVNKRVGVLQSIISGGRLHVDPDTCPMFLRAVTSEWTREPRYPGNPLDVHPWKDFVDPLGYILTGVFDVDEGEGRGDAVTLRVRDAFRGSATTNEPQRARHRPVYADTNDHTAVARQTAGYEP